MAGQGLRRGAAVPVRPERPHAPTRPRVRANRDDVGTQRRQRFDARFERPRSAPGLTAPIGVSRTSSGAATRFDTPLTGVSSGRLVAIPSGIPFGHTSPNTPAACSGATAPTPCPGVWTDGRRHCGSSTGLVPNRTGRTSCPAVRRPALRPGPRHSGRVPPAPPVALAQRLADPYPAVPFADACERDLARSPRFLPFGLRGAFRPSAATRCLQRRHRHGG